MPLPTYTALNDIEGPNATYGGRDFKVFTDFSSDIDLTSTDHSAVAKAARVVIVLAAGAAATLNVKAGQTVNRALPADLIMKFPIVAPVFAIIASGTSGVTSVLVIW